MGDKEEIHLKDLTNTKDPSICLQTAQWNRTEE